ncbi:organic cation transporter protein-like [Chironomus tepperi]|uniref:organic cation transporter protein-like n=1 Tax=Chironomus tepperi TaxID=113505 RepID=UPI00391FB7FE
MLDKRNRELSSVLLNYMFATGGVMAGVIVYYDSNWRNLTLWIAAPPIIFILEYWFVPESLCWLISKKSYSKAYKIVQKIAKDNKKELSAGIVSQFENHSSSKAPEVQESSKSEKSSMLSYIELLKSKKLLIRILVLCFIWSTNTLVFYGLSLYSISLSGNIYFNFIFVSLIEIPGTTIAWISMNKIGRRYPLVISFIISGIGSIFGAFVDAEVVWLQILLFLISKMAISTAFTITCVYTAEMMPTNTRSGCVGAFSTISRLSSLLAPFVPLLKNYYSFLPLLVFGSFPLAAGCLSLLLPETIGCNLPDTLSEAENIGK